VLVLFLSHYGMRYLLPSYPCILAAPAQEQRILALCVLKMPSSLF
jgi:hypothetical protein